MICGWEGVWTSVLMYGREDVWVGRCMGEYMYTHFYGKCNGTLTVLVYFVLLDVVRSGFHVDIE